MKASHICVSREREKKMKDQVHFKVATSMCFQRLVVVNHQTFGVVLPFSVLSLINECAQAIREANHYTLNTSALLKLIKHTCDDEGRLHETRIHGVYVPTVSC